MTTLRRLTFLSLLLALLLVPMAASFAQEGLPQVTVRLNNPLLDKENGTLIVDLELQSDRSGQQPFGMNVRFFYDATQLEFSELSALPDGYGILGALPKVHKGNHTSGAQLFGMAEAATFVNGAVQLFEVEKALNIPAEGWVKFFELHFNLTEDALSSVEDMFYPTIILDAKGNQQGGFLPGEDGIVLTLVEHDPVTYVESQPSIIATESFNWSYDQGYELPYGAPAEVWGVPLAALTASDDDQASGTGYRLFQNAPNPMRSETTIGFYLPKADEVTLRFFDLRGVEAGAVSGVFPAGFNNMTLDRSVLSVNSNALFYRMEVGDYRSETLKMIVIKE